jgi:hypothetical protein
MKYFSTTIKTDLNHKLNALTFTIPAETFTEAADKLDVFISGMQAATAMHVEILRLSRASRSLKQSITDGAWLSWHTEK